ncbi:MAG: hypothetical protein IPK17_29505 [Chloroflexi bacterium]|uniref:hypothetical protein n=1 Tax=Candidatus Flexifilum breve TaxID=3140694 RepID=UPI0031375770|nr:hypothetical protein [Chloroflexota bacterium]
MSVLKFTAAVVSTSSSYTVTTASAAGVEHIAAALAQRETRLVTGMLELARPVAAQQCLQDVDFKAGDRLVVLTQTTRAATFTPLRPGDKRVRVLLAGTEWHTHGQQPMLIGKSDNERQNLPDIDLRAVVSERTLDYISRRCVQIQFDERAQVWTAAKIGQTRVLLDDLEVGMQPVALSARHRLRLYRTQDNPALSLPLIELQLIAETVEAAGRVLPDGTFPVRVLLGTEQEQRTLRASSTLPLGQIGLSLIQYFQPTPITDMQLYIAHIIPPQTAVASMKPNETLYAALRPSPQS